MSAFHPLKNVSGVVRMRFPSRFDSMRGGWLLTGCREEMAWPKAHVRNGHVVVDEPTELPEGAEVEVVVTKVVDPFEGMSAEERAELEQELEGRPP